MIEKCGKNMDNASQKKIRRTVYISENCIYIRKETLKQNSFYSREYCHRMIKYSTHQKNICT